MVFFLQANAVRGVIAAVICAVCLVAIGLVVKFRYRQPEGEGDEGDGGGDGGNRRGRRSQGDGGAVCGVVYRRGKESRRFPI